MRLALSELELSGGAPPATRDGRPSPPTSFTVSPCHFICSANPPPSSSNTTAPPLANITPFISSRTANVLPVGTNTITGGFAGGPTLAHRSYMDVLMDGVIDLECPPIPIISPPWEYSDLLGFDLNEAETYDAEWEFALLATDALAEGSLDYEWELTAKQYLEGLEMDAGDFDGFDQGVEAGFEENDLSKGLVLIEGVGHAGDSVLGAANLGAEPTIVHSSSLPAGDGPTQLQDGSMASPVGVYVRCMPLEDPRSSELVMAKGTGPVIHIHGALGDCCVLCSGEEIGTGGVVPGKELVIAASEMVTGRTHTLPHLTGFPEGIEKRMVDEVGDPCRAPELKPVFLLLCSDDDRQSQGGWVFPLPEPPPWAVAVPGHRRWGGGLVLNGNDTWRRNGYLTVTSFFKFTWFEGKPRQIVMEEFKFENGGENLDQMLAVGKGPPCHAIVFVFVFELAFKFEKVDGSLSNLDTVNLAVIGHFHLELIPTTLSPPPPSSALRASASAPTSLATTIIIDSLTHTPATITASPTTFTSPI